MKKFNSYTVNKITDGELHQVSVKEEVRWSKPILEVVGKAIITHTGGYGCVKFEMNGTTYKSYGSPYMWLLVQDGWEYELDDIMHHMTAGDNSRTSQLVKEEVTGNIYLVNQIEFNLTKEERNELHNKYFCSKEGDDWWVDVPH